MLLNKCRYNYSVFLQLLLFVLIGGLFCYCTNTRSLPENEYLYTGLKKTQFHYPRKSLQLKNIQTDIEEPFLYTPNGAMLGLPHKIFPFRLWVYTYLQPQHKKGIRAWLYKKIAQPPVLLSQVNPSQRAKKAQNSLFNLGYFDTFARYELLYRGRGKRKVKVRYSIDLNIPYTIGQIGYPASVKRIDSLLHSLKPSSLLRTGDRFALKTLSQERKRLVELLKNHGYFFVAQNYLHFEADTSIGNRKVNLTLSIDSAAPIQHLQPFIVQQVRVILQTNLLTQQATQPLTDTLMVDGIELLYQQLYVKPELLRASILFRNGQLYTLENHNKTLKFLNNLGIFNSLNVQFDSVSINKQPALNITFIMTPQQRISLSAGMNMVTKSNGFAGPGADISLQDLNWHKRGERLSIKLNGGIEWLLGNKKENGRNIFSYALGANATLQIPQLLKVKSHQTIFEGFLPHSHIDAGVNLLNRVRYYKMIAWNTTLGYSWKNSRYINHNLEPVSLQYVKLLSSTEQFNEILIDNPLLAQSFQDQFILGVKYNFTFNHVNALSPDLFYLQVQSFTAGNALHLLSLLGGKPEEGESNKIFGNVYAQFFKVSADFRYARQLTKQTKLIFRLYGGMGIPYGNGNVLPYNEQFYTGGPSSIRAFRTRSLGPGTYLPATDDPDQSFLQQTGELKLEANLEYRFKLAGWLQAACFVDTGNIWLLEEDIKRPGGTFYLDQFLSQMAVGTGVGLRLDLGYVVARWDTGFSLKQPYRPEGDRWIFGASNFTTTLVGHLAIGYPF